MKIVRQRLCGISSGVLGVAVAVSLVAAGLRAEAATYYADNALGNNGFDGLSMVITNGHGPKRNIQSVMAAASGGDLMVAAAGLYQESQWSLGSKDLTLRPQGQVTIVDFNPGQADTDHDGIPDWWVLKYFGHPTGQAFDLSRTNDQADADGLTNYQEYLAGTDPLDSNSHPPMVATPTFAPDGGVFTTAENVTLGCTTDGAVIRYTTNGLDPTENDPGVSPGSTVHISAARRLKAKAWKDGMAPSLVKSADYVLPALMAAGSSHSFMLEPAGTLWAWGWNDYGQLGNGTTTNQRSPVQLAGISNVWTVAGGGYHTVAVDTNGTVWTWGGSWSGQLGNGTDGPDQSLPVPITGVSNNVVSVSAGELHTMALRADGRVWAWGDNENGQLGVGYLPGENQWTNIPVQAVGVTQAVAVAAGSAHSVALQANGTVWTWGANSSGQLGIGTTDESAFPTNIGGFGSVVAIAAGGYHSVAVKTNGTVWTCGSNVYGQLGRTGDPTTPGQVNGLSNVVGIAAGDSHTLAVTSSGYLFAWGYNHLGELGTNTPSQTNSPMLVTGISNAVMVSVGPGGDHSLAVTFYSGVNLFWGWGYNNCGQVGNGANTNQYAPALLHFSFDTDQDGLPDWQEYTLGSDPLSADQNGDGLLDGPAWTQQGINPTNMDVDADGIPNAWERQYGLDPFSASDASQTSAHPWAHGFLTNLQVYQNPGVLIADNYSTVSDGIADWWRVHYFGTSTTTNSDSCATCDPDTDSANNLKEYESGTDPLDGNSYTSMLLIPNAWAIYTATNEIQVTATILSTNASVTVAAAEWFHDSYAGVTNGTGSAMTATDGMFNSTLEVATNSFTPTFGSDRHLLWVHARGSDGQWCPFVKIVINPNVDDILDKVKANYSQIGNISYTMTIKNYVGDQVVSTETVLFRQKGPYKMRWDNQTTGATMIINGNDVGIIDESGQLTPLFIATGDDASESVCRETFVFWDVDRFRTQHDLGVASSVTNYAGGYRFDVTPKTGVVKAYDSAACEVDFRYGVVSAIDFTRSGGDTLHTEYMSATEVAPGIWLHSQQNWTIPVYSDWTRRHEEDIQSGTILINSDYLPDSLFEF